MSRERSADYKARDAVRKNLQYKSMTTVQRRQFLDRLKQRRKAILLNKIEDEKASHKTAIADRKKQFNALYCMRWREGKKPRRSNRIRRLPSKLIPAVAIFQSENKGQGVRAIRQLQPATIICEYGGRQIRNRSKALSLARDGNDKIIQVRSSKLWWDGACSTTIAPKVNHACDCVSNCQWLWDKDKPMLSTKATLDGLINEGVELTVDYNYSLDGIRNDPQLKWFVDYLDNHYAVCRLAKPKRALFD
jgi:hypothetical protein